MRQHLRDLVILLAVFGGLPFQVMTDSPAYANTPPLRVNGIAFGPADKSQFAPAYGCKADGSTDDSSCINTGLAAVTAGTFYLPSTSASYKIGTTTITVPSGVILQGTARNGTVLVYTGTGCAILLDSTDSAGVKNIYVQVNSSSSTAAGICLKNTTGDSKWNRIENVKVIQTNTPTTPVAGQVGILFDGSGGGSHALYWNRLDQVTLGGWDKAIKMIGSVGSANGPNANTFVDVMLYASQHGVSLEAYATENVFSSLMCSASGFAGTDCIKIGDGTNPTNFNMFFGATSDQGVGPVTYTIAANAVGNQLWVNSQSSSAGTDSGTRSLIFDALKSTAQVSHLQAGQSSPTVNVGNAAQLGTSPTATGSGSDITGTINFTPGTTPSAFSGGTAVTVATVVFANSYSSAPRGIVLTPASGPSAQVQSTSNGITFYVDSASTTSSQFVIKAISASTPTLSAGTSYKLAYTVIQ